VTGRVETGIDEKDGDVAILGLRGVRRRRRVFNEHSGDALDRA
jgi:hypothetical protein